MNIPNSLSIFRLVLIPCFIFAYFLPGESNNYLIASLIFVLSGLTDYFDGYIARRLNQITDLGKLLDPLADKLTQLTVFVCLYIDKIIPLWLVILYVVKELLIVFGSTFIYNKSDMVVSSKWFGRFSTAIFYAGVFFILTVKPDEMVTRGIIYAIFAIIITSCILYAVSYRDYIIKNKNL